MQNYTHLKSKIASFCEKEVTLNVIFLFQLLSISSDVLPYYFMNFEVGSGAYHPRDLYIYHYLPTSGLFLW